MSKIAKLMFDGRSQTVRLPPEFHFDAQEVFIWRDPVTGRVTLSTTPSNSWEEFMALRDAIGPAPDAFMADRQQSTETRNPFADWSE